MQLPGGIEAESSIERDFAFKPITGDVELEIADIAQAGDKLMAGRVTAMLCAALEHIGGKTMDTASVDTLCVGDRQYLMQRLAGYLGLDGGWYTASCSNCGEQFDFYIEQCRLPIKPAGPGFPYTQVDTSHGTYRFRLPTGGDQQAVADLEMDDAVQTLLRRCLVGESIGGNLQFGEQDRLYIEAALEALAPEVTTQVSLACPVCGATSVVSLNPYSVLDLNDGSILGEIHTIAWYYHWSEAAILALPRHRRKHYLRLIERSCRVSRTGAQTSGGQTWVS